MAPLYRHITHESAEGLALLRFVDAEDALAIAGKLMSCGEIVFEIGEIMTAINVVCGLTIFCEVEIEYFAVELRSQSLY